MKEQIAAQKIRLFAILSFVMPLIAINLCLLIFYYLGNIKVYESIDWKDNITVGNFDQYLGDSGKTSLFDCPKYEISSSSFILSNGKKIENTRTNLDKYKTNLSTSIKKIEFTHSKEINKKCIKNYFLAKSLVKYFNLELSFINLQETNSGFSPISNPYFYGEVSISRTARYFPATLIFKPLIILSALLLFLYWLNNFKFFSFLKEKGKLDNFSKGFFYLGILSCIFLILHSIFLGVNFESKLYNQFRKFVITAFIFSEVGAQIYLTITLNKFKLILSEYIKSFILNLKILFVFTVFIITIISLYVLAFKDPSTSFKNILEWNYFAALLIYYLLSRMMWRRKKL